MFNVAEVMEKIAKRLEDSHQREFDASLERLVNLNDYVMELSLIGIDIKLTDSDLLWRSPAVVDITEEELAKLRRHFRQLHQVSIRPVDESDARKKEVYVRVEPEEKKFHYLIHFQYKTKLTRDKKCKIVKQKSEYTTIVCSTGL